MNNRFFDRRILGLRHRGCRIDPQTRQSVVFAKHSGDIAYDLIGATSISKKSEYRDLNRERLMAPVLNEDLNEVGQNKRLIKRTQKRRYVNLSD